MVHKYHKADKKYDWRRQGLILSSEEEFEEIYDRYINSTNCEKCGKEYKSTRDKHMDHAHTIHDKYGYFRNILCRSCNTKRCKISKNNTSGYNGIFKEPSKYCAQGYIWVFRVSINGKQKAIKSSTNKELLIKFATKWKIDNHYND